MLPVWPDEHTINSQVPPRDAVHSSEVRRLCDRNVGASCSRGSRRATNRDGNVAIKMGDSGAEQEAVVTVFMRSNSLHQIEVLTVVDIHYSK